MRITPTRVVALATAAAAAAIAAVQLRGGIVPMLDTVSYWSGAVATSQGHPFTTTLAPSFSNFSALDVLERGGRLPFVDFPVAYPTVAGVLGSVIGVTWAMGLMMVTAAAVLGWSVVVGRAPAKRSSALAVRSIGVIGIVLLSAYRLTTQATLSEPIFCALAVAFVVALSRYRDEAGPWWSVAVLGTCLGLFRFVGAPLTLLAGAAHLRRNRSLGAATVWTLAMMAPTVANMVWASSSGGGHGAGWRGLESQDVRWLARSIGGWVESGQGDLRYTYFGGAATAWWTWLLAVAVLVGCMMALLSVALGAVGRPRRLLPDALELPLASAGILIAGLVVGMLGFDALVAPDNRLMLPAGVLVLTGAIWWVSDIVDTNRADWVAPTALTGVIGWTALAAPVWHLDEIFSDSEEQASYVRAALSSGSDLVFVNDADGTHWNTGIAAAYTPQPTKALTGEPVDVDAVFVAIPCPLSERNAVVILADEALFGAGGSPVLALLVEQGRLVVEPFDGGLVYRAGPEACP